VPAGQKIITTLHERRQIEADLRDMLTSTSEADFRRRAQQIAALGSQVIPAIAGSLLASSRADARLLEALGTVATYLDRDEIVQALRQVVLEPGHTDQSRIGALTILERFLDQEPDDELLTSLSNPEGVALSSLEEVLARGERDPSVLVEYVQGLDRQEPDIVLTVVGALHAIGDRRAVELLRMMAQDVRDEIAARALQTLASLRLPEAAVALRTLIPVIAPDLRSLAERSLRKLQFAGLPLPSVSPPDEDWRSLIGPVDGLGRQSVWFVRGSRSAEQVRFLNVLLSDRAGAVEAAGHGHVPAFMLPPWRESGYVHDIPVPGGPGVLLLLEAPFDLGRRLVLEALARNRETQIPVAATLRLFSTWLWDVTGAEVLPPKCLPQLGPDDQALSEASGRLLEHPAFVTWAVQGEIVLQTAQELSQHPDWLSKSGSLEMWVTRLAAELFAEPIVAQVFSRRLEAMSEWLLLAGDETEARLALVAAQWFAGRAPRDHPLIRAMVRRALELALPQVGA
jgi:hypothetical protein